MASIREICLIGINHKYQLGPDGVTPVDAPRETFAEFRQFLTAAIARRGIRGIAEEMSPFALKKHFISGDSIPASPLKLACPTFTVIRSLTPKKP